MAEQRIKLIVSYDGTDFAGWQRQPRRCGPTVQQVIEDRLTQLVGERVVIHGAGRTDSGVHALGQCCHFVLTQPLPVEKLVTVLNHQLPEGVRVLAAQPVADDFHARFSARGKHYRYTIEQQPPPSAFAGRYSWQLPQALDAAAMREAAALLLGRHDFRHFTLTQATVSSYERCLTRLEISEPEIADSPLPWLRLYRPLLIDVEGDGFLYKMVRIIAARLVAVGRGQIAPSAMQDFLAGRPVKNIPPAPAQGLMLVEVKY